MPRTERIHALLRFPRLAALVLTLLLAVLPAATALASWMVPGLPIRPKDFTLVKHEGLYHLFYIRHNLYLPDDTTEVDLGHAVSPDLWTWQQLPPVLHVRDSSWDQTHVWSPSIVEQDGVFYLFYTGVISQPGSYSTYQRIGVATSADLMQWNPMDLPVYSCPQVSWSVCDSLQTDTAFRDPFVMADPAHPGHWLLYYSTYPVADSAGMVVAAATSDGDLTQWSDLGPLWITNRAYTYNSIVESPHLFQHNGSWYLFFTTTAGQPISFCTGPDPVGAPATWTYRGRLGAMLGYDTAAWYASEYLRDGLVEYFGYVVADRVDIRRIVWGTDWRFSLAQPDYMHVRSLDWSQAVAQEGDSVVLTLVTANPGLGSVSLEALRVRYDGALAPVSLSRLGLPATVTPVADTTRVTWGAHREALPTDSAGVMRLIVRTTDQTAVSPVLMVAPVSDGGSSSDPVDRPRGSGIIFRALPGPLPTSQRGILVQLDRPGPARVDVFDLQGRRLRTLVDRELPAGATVVAWDGRDAGGAALAPGIYLARLATPQARRAVRLVVLR